MSIILPPYLQQGDTIGIVCPGSQMAYEKVGSAVKALQSWGYIVKVGRTVGSSSTNYFSGTDEERLDDLQQMMDDKHINAIFCARGGYGTGRIIDLLNFKKFKKNPKWIIGFSDITVLHAHLYAQYNIAALHAPMAGAFNDGEPDDEYIKSLRNALAGKKANYTIPDDAKNQYGKATGPLIGGNLSLLAHLVGTPSDMQTKGRILFIEDVGEYIYNIDRMMYQLKRSGKLKNLAGLIVGGFSDMKDTTIPFGQTATELIREVVKEYHYPMCFNFPVSHDKENYALKTGVEYQLKVSGQFSVLKEL